MAVPRLLVLALVVCLGVAGCQPDSAEGASADPDSAPGQDGQDDGSGGEGGGDAPSDPGDPGDGDAPEPGGDAPSSCVSDAECEPAAGTCCECPTFSLPVSEGYGAACEDVDCGPAPEESCAPTRVQCDEGTCRLQCEAVGCNVRCEYGFAPDAAGCLRCSVDACAPPPPAQAECELDSDCARVPADCCGCSNGGADTAVASDRVDEHLESLECDDAPICPGVDVCDPDDAPRCIDGMCMLAPPPGDGDDDVPGPPGEQVAVCGTLTLPCPAGQVCVLNDPEAQDATRRGLGVCRSL